MPEPLDYQAPQEQATIGHGYFAINTLNLIGLILGMFLFPKEISGDSYAPMYAIFGSALLTLQLFAGTLPAVIYIANNASAMSKWQKAVHLALCIEPPVFDLIGIVLAVKLPTTHGSTC